MKRVTHRIPEEQWALFLNMLKICRSIKLAAERCEIAPATAYFKGYKDVAFFEEVTKILQGDYEEKYLPIIKRIAYDIDSPLDEL